jgi:uncharacterized protein (TIGR02996 family)
LACQSDYAALLRAVLEAPDDDAPRLVMADWLEDHGEPGRAEFVRVQVELARSKRGPRQHWEPAGHKWVEKKDDCGRCRYCALRRRETELWSSPDAIDWYDPRACGLNSIRFVGANIGYVRPVGFVARGFVGAVECETAAFLGGPCDSCQGRGHHGMDPGRVAKPCQRCAGTGRTPGLATALFAAHPVTAVRLVDREPRAVSDRYGEGWTWSRQPAGTIPNPHTVPDVIRRLMRLDELMPVPSANGYVRWKTRGAAEAALSLACVAYGRQLAGLPEYIPHANAPAHAHG